MADQFVPTSEIAKLVANSYEDLHDRLAESVQANRSKIFGKVERVALLGTFPTHALVAASDGRFAHVKYEQVEGQIKILTSTPVSVPTYSDRNVGDYVADRAKLAVESFLKGEKNALLLGLTEMATVVDEKPRMSDEQIADRLALMLGEDKAWKRVFQERKVEMKGAIIDHITPLENARLTRKFDRLYGSGLGVIPADKHEGFRDLVNEDFKYLADRLIALTDLVSIALESVISVKGDMKEESSDSTFSAFKAFSEALLSDLAEVCKIVVESPDRIRPVSALGKIYDAAAEELFNYEIAGRYVERMASRICGNPA